MNAREERAAFAARFRAAGNDDRARNEKRYLKSDLVFYGVPVPVIRRTAKAFYRDHTDLTREPLVALARELWNDDHHELRMLGIALLELYEDRLLGSDLALVEELLRRSNTWAQADWLATKVARSIVARFPATKRTVRRWGGDENLWVRRSALLALDPRARRSDFELFEELASGMLGEREFFLRKAIGWVLRETSKSHPDLAYGFLLGHIDRVAGLTLREGSRLLPSDQRATLLQLRATKAST
jgi:3-methyladenine DNA glycosylase AlkD